MARSPGWRHDLSPAARWVVAHGLDTEVRPPEVLDDETWRQLRADSSTHKLDGLLVHAVASEALAVSSSQADQVAELEIDLTRARMWQERRLIEVVDLIEAGGIEVRALKGLAVGALDYPDPQMRPTGDVDLLVRGHDLDRAAQLVVDIGGVWTDPDPRPGFSAQVGKGVTLATTTGEIDLHRLLVWGPLGVRLDPDLLWSDSRAFSVGDRSMRTLTRDDTLLHACSHLLVLGARRAPELRDVAQLATPADLDVEGLLVRARQWRAEAMLATAVLLTAEELGLQTLRDSEFGQWAAGYPITLRDRLWLRVERPQEPVRGLEAAATLFELPDRQARMELVRASVRPAPGTYDGPARRLGNLARKLSHRGQPTY